VYPTVIEPAFVNRVDRGSKTIAPRPDVSVVAAPWQRFNIARACVQEPGSAKTARTRHDGHLLCIRPMHPVVPFVAHSLTETSVAHDVFGASSGMPLA
jgi:hypothetical protein